MSAERPPIGGSSAKSAERELISCLTVTRPGRLAELAESIACFDAQTHSRRELVILHDGPGDFDRDLTRLAGRFGPAPIRVVRTAPGSTLGTLRNQAIEHARGEIVCQWDDDDLCHPLRLTAQLGHLVERDAAACFLTDQLHLFEPTGEIHWDDWTVEQFPMCLIQGTLVARRSTLGPYPDEARGEDTSVVLDLISAGARVAALQDHGWAYVYRFNGRNAWDEHHHRAISEWKAMTGSGLAERAAELGERLGEYPVPARTLTLRGGDVSIPVRLGGGHGRDVVRTDDAPAEEAVQHR